MTPNPDVKTRYYSTMNISVSTRYRHMVTTDRVAY